MSLDIGAAIREGFSRALERNGLILAAVFAGIALLTTILVQSASVGVVEASLQAINNVSPADLGISESEYDDLVAELETTAEQTRETTPLALGIPLSVSALGLLVVALGAEAVSIVAVRTFGSEQTERLPDDATRNILIATLNGFVGGIIVWVLIIVGLGFLLVPGLFAAVVFYFLRQEIALNDKNFVQAMADSWRSTKGNRLRIFGLGAVVVSISQLEFLPSLVAVLPPSVTATASALLGGFLAAFGAAAVTRAYVQLTDDTEQAESDPEDPYDAALSADDLS